MLLGYDQTSSILSSFTDSFSSVIFLTFVTMKATPISALVKNVFARKETVHEEVYYDLKASPEAAKDMSDLAKSLGETP
ncbi:MAG: hypothetical protein TE42_02020 [Candidatus Synechococcus spongiarum SP3]|uniref:Uncharacterized protein n=1 Tax=Candidatus Synechococcus spongiarum SP3 TaxID=1604020 RepID=A0A0G2IWX3_9SYNE|nr:MAG: hypothetical protein TE42_02020 [Candidatus Synechococcus spongiarum SP3]